MTKTKRVQFKWMRFIFEGKQCIYCLDKEGEQYSRQRSKYRNHSSRNSAISEQADTKIAQAKDVSANQFIEDYENEYFQQNNNTEFTKNFDTLEFSFAEPEVEDAYFPITNEAPLSNLDFDFFQNDDEFPL